MKKFNYFMMFTALVGLAFFTACERNANPETSQSAVKFTGDVNNMSKTRAAGTAWAEGDAIGIFMVNAAPAVVEGAANRRYTTTAGNGDFTPIITTEPASNSTIYYPMNPDTRVGFIAYYPYLPDAVLETPISITIPADQNPTDPTDSTTEVQPTFDLLYATTTTVYNKTSGPVNFVFDHKLSKVVFNIVDPGDEPMPATGIPQGDLAGMTAMLSNWYSEVLFNLASPGYVVTASVNNSFARKLNTPTPDFYATYDAIIIPYSYDTSIVVDFVIPDTVETPGVAGTYKLTLENPNFESGNVYTYNVRVTRTGIVVENSTINPWTGGDGISIDAE